MRIHIHIDIITYIISNRIKHIYICMYNPLTLSLSLCKYGVGTCIIPIFPYNSIYCAYIYIHMSCIICINLSVGIHLWIHLHAGSHGR